MPLSGRSGGAARAVLLVSLQPDLTVIGLRYVHYALLAAGVDSCYLHLPAFGRAPRDAEEALVRFVERVQPQWVGISLMSTELAQARRLTALLHSRFEGLLVVWGGVHPTIDPDGCLADADYACVGEGEQVAVDLTATLARGGDPREVAGLAYMADGRAVRNPTMPVVEELDRLPIYEHIPRNGFIQEPGGAVRALDERMAVRYGRYQHKFYDVLTSRGCPFRCTYCCSDLVSRIQGSKKVRRRSVESVIGELEKAVHDFPMIEMVNFHDENFLSHDLGFLEAFTTAYRERVNKPFMFASIPLYIRRDKMKLLKDAGLVWIRMGLQSGSDRVLRDVYQRKSSSRQFLDAAAVLDELGIAAYCDVILDNPFETVQDQLDTIDTLLAAPRPFYLQLYSLSMYFGSSLYERTLRECPERLEDATVKDYLQYRRTPVNELTRLAAYLPRPWVRALVARYRENPNAGSLGLQLAVARRASAICFEPISHLRVFKRSQRDSFWQMLTAMPAYTRIWLDRFRRQWVES